MTNKERILEAAIFIEANLKSEINVSDIAKVSCCSLYHFIRLFQNIVGVSPKKFLNQRRLTESIEQLRNSNKKIIDIAFDFQFSSHEVYTRSFQKHFGTTPSKIRAGENIPLNLLCQPISEEFIFQSQKARDQEPEILELEEIYLVGLSYFIEGDLNGLNLSSQWNALMKSAHLITNKHESGKFFQLQYWSENQQQEGMHFFIGVEVNNFSSINPQFVAKAIPKGKYLKFIHKGLSRNVGFTYRYIYNEYLPNTTHILSLPFNFEMYGDKYISPNKEESESHLFIPI